MSLEIPRRLPSLAHPIIASPENNKDGIPLRRPPFPDIDLNAEGITFSYFSWVGLKTDVLKTPNACVSGLDARKLNLAYQHELCHHLLSQSPFSMFIKSQMLKLFAMLLWTFEEKQEQIQVPLDPEKARNLPEKQWAFITLLDRASRGIDEVYAVRSSLLIAREKLGVITDTLLDRLIDHYKKEYGKEIREFQAAYNAFELVAGKIGKTAAHCLVYNAFETLSPTNVSGDLKLLSNG